MLTGANVAAQIASATSTQSTTTVDLTETESAQVARFVPGMGGNKKAMRKRLATAGVPVDELPQNKSKAKNNPTQIDN